MSGLTPDMSRVKVEGGGQRKSPGKAPRHRALPRSLLKTKPDVGGITADIERLLVLDALVKPIESDMDKLIKQIKAHMAVTGETRIEVRSVKTTVFRDLLLFSSTDVVSPLLRSCALDITYSCTPTHPPTSEKRPARAT